MGLVCERDKPEAMLGKMLGNRSNTHTTGAFLSLWSSETLR